MLALLNTIRNDKLRKANTRTSVYACTTCTIVVVHSMLININHCSYVCILEVIYVHGTVNGSCINYIRTSEILLPSGLHIVRVVLVISVVSGVVHPSGAVKIA